MNLGRYLVGVGELVVIVGALGYGAARLRARFLADWSGAPARLAEVTIVASALLLVLQIAGAAQILDPGPIAVGAVAAGAAMAWIGRPPRGAERTGPSPQMGTAASAIALAAIMLVAVHWATAAEHSFSVGLYGGDENWYHLPYPARLAQEGSITALQYASPDYLSWFHPLNSELFHGMGMVLFDRDILSPFLNLIWFAIAVLAAWCIGRPFGVAPLTAVAAALALDLPVFAETQAGSAMSDLFGVTFLLVAVAILLNGRVGPGDQGSGSVVPGALAVAGLATGLAFGGKLSFAAPVVVLLAGVVAFAPAGARRRAALLFGGPLLATGSFWYLRDLWHSGSPFPYVQEIGPIDLPGPNQDLSQNPYSVAHYLFDGSVWSDYFVPGLEDRIGPVWFLLVGIAVFGIVAALIQRRDRLLTVFGAAGAISLAFYLLTPAAAEGPEGMPREFTAGLRVFVPPLLMGLVLGALAVVRFPPTVRWGALGVLSLGVLVATGRDAEFWDGGGQLAAAALIASALILLPLALLAIARRGQRGPAIAALAGAGALVVAVAVGWGRTEDYLEHRYRTDDAPEYFKSLSLVPVYRWASGQQDRRIGTSGILQYGLYGEDLSNHVQFLGEVGSDESFREITNCPDWRRAVNEGDYDYVVAMPRYGGTREIQTRWTRGSAADPVLHSGPITVFRVTGALDPADCGTLPSL